MDIPHLKYFVEVAKQKNFTRASETLHVSQPSISKMIKSLEEELNVTLLDRSERQVELTDAGKVVYDQAVKVLQTIEAIPSFVNDIVHVKKGTIKIGFMPTLGVMLFPSVLAGFKKSYPQIDMQMVEFSGKQLEQKVVQGEVDVGITALPICSDKFGTIPLSKEELIVIVDKEHWLAGKESVLLSELKDEPFILFTEEYVLHDVVMKACLQAGFEPHVVYKSSLWDIVGEMVTAQFGISLVPKSVANRFENRVSMVPVTSLPVDWKLALIYNKQKYMSYAVQAFIAFIESRKPEL